MVMLSRGEFLRYPPSEVIYHYLYRVVAAVADVDSIGIRVDTNHAWVTADRNGSHQVRPRPVKYAHGIVRAYWPRRRARSPD